MAFIHTVDLPFHEGEKKMHELLHLPSRDNPTSPFMTPGAAYMLLRAPLLALGTLDAQGRPWTTIWGGKAGFCKPLGQSVIGIDTLVDTKYDPVTDSLWSEDGAETISERDGAGKMVGGLTIDLETRSRVKLYGKVIAGTGRPSGEKLDGNAQSGKGLAQLVVRIEQSLGNCPKYITIKHIHPAVPSPRLVSSSSLLPQQALSLLRQVDMFFITSSNHRLDMDTNIRGGPPGFVRVLPQSPSSTTTILVYPEYSGNRLYQTLGNLQTTPRAGLVFPDFESGDVLYVTGNTEILVGKDAATILPRSNLAVKLTITAARFVESGLAFRGSAGERSPYNPPVRYLSSEAAMLKSFNSNSGATATLINKELLTPTIARFRFRISNISAVGTWQPGQYVALSFEDELSMGYSHMRDDDPKSLNDDYTRTFTVSSAPGSGTPKDEFEITIRNVGTVTGFLFKQSPRAGLEVPLRGFGGEFRIAMEETDGLVPFVAGGIGITPLLAQVQDLDIPRLRVFWTLGLHDIGLVVDTLKQYPTLVSCVIVFFTGTANASSKEASIKLEQLIKRGVNVKTRRITPEDLKEIMPDMAPQGKWYICAGAALRKSLLGWLEGREPVYESFDY